MDEEEKTIADLAPTMLAGGISEDEIAETLTPAEEVLVVATDPIPQPKRYKEAFKLLVSSSELSDREISNRVASMRPDIVAAMRSELSALQKAPDTKTTTQLAQAKSDKLISSGGVMKVGG